MNASNRRSGESFWYVFPPKWMAKDTVRAFHLMPRSIESGPEDEDGHPQPHPTECYGDIDASILGQRTSGLKEYERHQP
jgi:hypothetical protein